MSYRRRYEREHYVKRKIRRDIYSKLVELSRREGLGLQELLEKLIEAYEGHEEIPGTHTARRGARKIPIYKVMTVDGEVAYLITLNEETITLTHKELRILCRSGLVDITLCTKTVLA